MPERVADLNLHFCRASKDIPKTNKEEGQNNILAGRHFSCMGPTWV